MVFVLNILAYGNRALHVFCVTQVAGRSITVSRKNRFKLHKLVTKVYVGDARIQVSWVTDKKSHREQRSNGGDEFFQLSGWQWYLGTSMSMLGWFRHGHGILAKAELQCFIHEGQGCCKVIEYLETVMNRVVALLPIEETHRFVLRVVHVGQLV